MVVLFYCLMYMVYVCSFIVQCMLRLKDIYSVCLLFKLYKPEKNNTVHLYCNTIKVYYKDMVVIIFVNVFFFILHTTSVC